MSIEVSDGPHPVSQSVRDLWDLDPALMGRVLRNLRGAVEDGSRIARGIQRGVSAWRRAEHWSSRARVRDSRAMFGILPNPGSRRVSLYLTVRVKGHGRYSSAGEGRVVAPNLYVRMIPLRLGRQGNWNGIVIATSKGD